MSVNHLFQDRGRMVLGGLIVLLLLVVCGVIISVLVSLIDKGNLNTGKRAPITELTYCPENPEGPCVVSFGIDGDGNTLVNLLLPDPDYPEFILQVLRDGSAISYECVRTKSSPMNVVCVGVPLAPGEVFHWVLVSVSDQTTLAEGDLSIIGLVFPTLGVVTQTPLPTGTPAVTLTPRSTSTAPVSYP